MTVWIDHEGERRPAAIMGEHGDSIDLETGGVTLGYYIGMLYDKDGRELELARVAADYRRYMLPERVAALEILAAGGAQ